MALYRWMSLYLFKETLIKRFLREIRKHEVPFLCGFLYKITYHGDPRYMVTIGKTPSDNRSGNNNAAMISKTML